MHGNAHRVLSAARRRWRWPMDSRNKQIPKPKHWQEFEELCLALFREVWKDKLAQKNGRVGQPQHGVDVWGAVDGNRSRFQGVQCKGKDESLGSTLTESELLSEIMKAEKFSPGLEHWVLATTAAADAELQRIAREISVDRERQGKFTVQVMGWGDLESMLSYHWTVLEAFYPELGLDAATLARTVRLIARSQVQRQRRPLSHCCKVLEDRALQSGVRWPSTARAT